MQEQEQYTLEAGKVVYDPSMQLLAPTEGHEAVTAAADTARLQQ